MTTGFSKRDDLLPHLNGATNWLSSTLSLLGEILDYSCYPFASLDKNIDSLILIGSVCVTLGVVAANSHSRQPQRISEVMHRTRGSRSDEGHRFFSEHFSSSLGRNLRD